jgi:Tfp pilus assembly protein PilX
MPTRLWSPRGFVLPVVLVMLVLMTSVVLYLVRRGAIDERMAANMRGTTTLESAVAYTLRYCETMVWQAPPGVAPPSGALWNPPPTVTPEPGTTAWRVDANWAGGTARAISLPQEVLGANMPDVTRAQCLIEDATAELDAAMEMVTDTQNSMVQDSTLRKYRITAEVASPSQGFTRFARAQSEVRMNVN